MFESDAISYEYQTDSKHQYSIDEFESDAISYEYQTKSCGTGPKATFESDAISYEYQTKRRYSYREYCLRVMQYLMNIKLIFFHIIPP